ncbi:MAG: hypothetical protein IJ891_13325 [Prevotella sp.]|nr:hypothetical protein [Prevotella sp.]
MGKNPIEWRPVIKILSNSEPASLRFAALHIAAQHLSDTTGHRPLYLEHHVVMVRHHLVREDSYLRTKFQHSSFLVDECPPDRRLFHYRLRTIVRK